MRKILGSLLLALTLLADSYEVILQKERATIFEPILLELAYKTENKKEIDWIKFEPKRSAAYERVVLKKESPQEGYRFYYLLFPKKAGKIEIDYELKLKIAPFAEIQNKILGTGYEQTNPIEGRIETIQITPSQLQIQNVKADLYGKFTLDVTIDASKKEAFEPLYLTIHLQGVGYPPKITDPLPKIEGIKKLADKPIKKITYRSDGAHIDYLFRYALVADHSFQIPALHFKAFDFERSYALTTKPIPITITSPAIKPDERNDPEPIEPVAKKFGTLLSWLIIYLAGFLSGIVAAIIVATRFKEPLFILTAERFALLAHLTIRYPDRFGSIKAALQEEKRLFWIKIKLIKELLWSKR